jgi:hypothetical protein
VVHCITCKIVMQYDAKPNACGDKGSGVKLTLI